MGQQIPLLELKACLDSKLLAVLVKVELAEDSVTEVSSTSLEKHLRKFQMPDLDKKFGILRLGAREVDHENGYDTCSSKWRKLFHSMDLRLSPRSKWSNAS